MSSISSVSSRPQVHHVSTPPVKSAGTDSDGDNDGSKAGNVEAKQPPKPVSATIGNRINTTA
jgi:hypothetical protein